MDEETALIGSPITLAELKLLGGLVRWQEVGPRVAELVAAKRLPHGYPLVATRLATDGLVDLCSGDRWRQVAFVGMAGSRMGGDYRILFREDGAEKTTPYDWYRIAPAGHFTEWKGARPESLKGAQLREGFELVQRDHHLQSQSLAKEEWPYLTFKTESFNMNAVNFEGMTHGSYTLHAADPRVKIDGITPREPWFNTTIAVSHRWLTPEHPDPEGVQYRELLEICETLNLHDNQALLIDYCSLPQHPRTPEEAVWFRDNLQGFQTQFKYVTVVLNTGSDDYSTRAWCMLELMLAAMSKAKNPTLLNHDRLDKPLNEARELAEHYLKHSVWNQQQMLRGFGGGLTMSSYRDWSRDLTNVALYNASIEGRRKIVEKFENELAVTEPNDRAIVVKLLKQLAFGEEDE